MAIDFDAQREAPESMSGSIWNVLLDPLGRFEFSGTCVCVSLACGSSSIEKQLESDSKHSHESCIDMLHTQHEYKWYNQAQNRMNKRFKWRAKIQMNSHKQWSCSMNDEQPFNNIYCKRLTARAPLDTDRGHSRPRPDLWPAPGLEDAWASVGCPYWTHRRVARGCVQCSAVIYSGTRQGSSGWRQRWLSAAAGPDPDRTGILASAETRWTGPDSSADPRPGS